MLIYHLITITTPKDYIDYKNLGICSPKALYDLNKDLFIKTSYQNYLERTSTYLHKPKKEITPEDTINFLDNAPIRKNKGFNSQTIFFTFHPFNKLHKGLQNLIKPCVQLTVDTKYLKRYIPKLVMFGSVKPITWDELEDIDFIDWIDSMNNKGEPTNTKRIYARLPHLAVLNAYQVKEKNIYNAIMIR